MVSLMINQLSVISNFSIDKYVVEMGENGSKAKCLTYVFDDDFCHRFYMNQPTFFFSFSWADNHLSNWSYMRCSVVC